MRKSSFDNQIAGVFDEESASVFHLLCTQGVVAREVNVANHGVVPGKDVTYSLNRLIESVKGEAGVTLVFPKGRYEFYHELIRHKGRRSQW